MSEEKTNAVASFSAHMATYTVFSLVFIVMDMAGNQDNDKPIQLNWAYWPILLWGIGLAVHAVIFLMQVTQPLQADDNA